MKTRKVKLSEILWDAANKHLAKENVRPFSGVSHFSCDAVFACLDEPTERAQALQYLKSLGCDTASFGLFGEFNEGIERQGVRYTWLLLAMHVAEDEGIEIEVQA